MAEHTHVHGKSHMTIIMDGKQLMITFTATAHDLLGFESKPENDAKKTTLDNAIKKLNATDQWLTIMNGKCTKNDGQLINPFNENNLNLDFDLSMTFTCQTPHKIKKIKASIHQQFERIIETEVQWITENNQGLVILNKNDNTVILNGK